MRISLAFAQPNKLCGTLFFGALLESAIALPTAVNSTSSAMSPTFLADFLHPFPFGPILLLLSLAIAPLFVYFKCNPRTVWSLSMLIYNFVWCLAMYCYDPGIELTWW